MVTLHRFSLLDLQSLGFRMEPLRRFSMLDLYVVFGISNGDATWVFSASLAVFVISDAVATSVFTA